MFGHTMEAALAEAYELAGDDGEARAATDRALAESARTGERFYLAGVHLTTRARAAASFSGGS
jgi:hypothetical protein